MSYTSANARWLESAAMDTLFEADKPVTANRARLLMNNLSHLLDTSTQVRISDVAYVGETITPTDFGGDADNPSPVRQYTTRWSGLDGARVARPVLRVGAHRNAAGTSYLSAGLFPYGARQDASGYGAIAYWPETSFTNTSAAIVIEAAADSRWPSIRNSPFNRRKSHPGHVSFGTTDPDAAGASAPASPLVFLVTLAIWVRHTGTSETRISLVELREFSGPTP